jgi:hypothetical protein
LKRTAVNLTTLPQRVVAVSHGQFRHRRRPTLERRGVQRLQFLKKIFQRPAIRDYVVHHQHEHPVVIAELQQLDPEQRVSRQIEQKLHVRARDSRDLCIALDTSAT